MSLYVFTCKIDKTRLYQWEAKNIETTVHRPFHFLFDWAMTYKASKEITSTQVNLTRTHRRVPDGHISGLKAVETRLRSFKCTKFSFSGKLHKDF